MKSMGEGVSQNNAITTTVLNRAKILAFLLAGIFCFSPKREESFALPGSKINYNGFVVSAAFAVSNFNFSHSRLLVTPLPSHPLIVFF